MRKSKDKNINNVTGEIDLDNVRKIDPSPDKTSYDPLKIVYGWSSSVECANEVWGGLHRSLLNGNLVFAYKSHDQGTPLSQIIVVQNIDQASGLPLENDFAVGMITPGFTALYPHVPWEYLNSTVTDDLSNYKVGKDIQKIYKQIIDRLGV